MKVGNLDLVRLHNLQLVGKKISDMLQLGMHPSIRAGMGTEFEQYRHYQAGDDLRRIDWKRLARTGKYMVQESAIESHQRFRFMLDLSGSMNYEEGGFTRLDYAKMLIASLANMAYRQGDEISLFGLKDGQIEVLTEPGKQAFRMALYQLEKAEAGGKWIAPEEGYFSLINKQKEILVLVSDLLQVNEEWLQTIKSLISPRREIIIVQLLGEQEIDFSIQGFYRFQDLESGKHVELNASSVRADYLKAMRAYLGMLEDKLRFPNLTYLRISLQTPIAEAVRDCVLKHQQS